jgi:hypothetical protein
MIPHACKNLNSNPVPISVVLKRIPFEAFKESGLIRNLQDSVVKSVIKKFGDLMDIQNRFLALQASTAKHKDLVPNLASAVNEVTLSFQKVTIPLLERLAAYVAAYKSDKPKEDFVNLLTAVQAEIDKQKSSSQMFLGYPMHLAGLEDAFKSFALLNYKIANKTKNSMFFLTPLPALRKDVVFTPIVALLIVPPLPPQPDLINDLAIRALLVDAVAYYTSVTPPVKLHIIYTEDLSKIDTALGGKGMFTQLKGASVFLGQKKMGAISWTPVPEKDIANVGVQLCDLRLDLCLDTRYFTILFDEQIIHHDDYLSCHRFYLEKSRRYKGHIPNQTDNITSQTLILRGQYENSFNKDSPHYFVRLEDEAFTSFTFCVRHENVFNAIRDAKVFTEYIDVKVDVEGEGGDTSFFLVDRKLGLKNLKQFQDFHCAFVQDSEKSPPTWALYFNGVLVGKMRGSTLRWRDVSTGIGIDGKVRSTSFFCSSVVT